MTPVNIIWSILAKGDNIAGAYTRKVSPAVYKRASEYEAVIDLLIPSSSDLWRFFQIEQVTQLIFRSDLREQALLLDPLNTYEKASLVFPTSGCSDNAPVTINYYDTGIAESFRFAECRVDPAGSLITINGSTTSYVSAHGLTSHIAVTSGLTMRMRGVMPLVPFDFTIIYTPFLVPDWSGLLTSLENARLSWTDASLRAVWKEDFLWLNRISAVALSAVENSLANY